MQDENKTPANEPQEVVGQYIRDDSREVTDCYVYSQPLPAAAMPRISQASQMPQKHSRRGLWIFLIIAMVLIIAVIVAALTSRPMEDGGYADDGHDASSIVDIFGNEIPTIDRVQGDPALRFSCTPQEGDALTAQEVYASVNPAVVMVAVALDEDKASIGTGVILTEDGYVVTNAHVIAGGSSAWVALDTGDVLDAELVGFDSGEDLALLKLVDVTGLPTAQLGDSDECVVGDAVYAIGNPLGVELRGTLTSGLISAIDRRVTLEGRVMTMLQTTAALNNGNSGGPLINDRGQVIGINTLKMSGNKTATATVEGLGFAVPARRMVAVVNDIMATGAFHGIPSLGIYVGQELQADDTYQLVIYDVTEDYGAEEAGLLPGDVILAADGVEVHETWELLELRSRHIVSEDMVLTVQRGGEIFDVPVTLYAVTEE